MRENFIVEILTVLSLLINHLSANAIQGGWKKITDECRIDFDGNVRFFATDGFRICNDVTCPAVGPSVFGNKCKQCCAHVNKTAQSMGFSSNGVESSTTNNNYYFLGGTIGLLVILVIILVLYITKIKKRPPKRTIMRDDSLSSASSAASSGSRTGGLSQYPKHLQKQLITADSTQTLTGAKIDLAVNPSSYRSPLHMMGEGGGRNNNSIVTVTNT